MAKALLWFWNHCLSLEQRNKDNVEVKDNVLSERNITNPLLSKPSSFDRVELQ
jgi:hypothetical protein